MEEPQDEYLAQIEETRQVTKAHYNLAQRPIYRTNYPEYVPESVRSFTKHRFEWIVCFVGFSWFLSFVGLDGILILGGRILRILMD